METKRLFIAINFDDATRASLQALRDELRSVSRSGNFSLPENLHLTLAFLGECDTRQTAAAKEAMKSVGFEPFQAVIERVGRFRRDDGDLWWAGLREDKPLMDLQRALSERLCAAGFSLEERRYSPHITLGRKVETTARPWQPTPFGQTINQIDLMKSERINGKLTYTSIYTKKHGG